MEKGSVFGLVACFVGVFLGAMLKGADIVSLFTNIPAILIVILGSIGATMIAFPFAATAALPKYFKKAILPGPQPDPTETIELIVKLTNRARTEGLLLDPVYTGKAVKGLIDYARKGRWAGETVVFLHTGGAQGLSGYASVLEGHLE